MKNIAKAAHPLAISNKTNTMLTIILFVALLVLGWLIFKSIDWFEKI